MYPFLCLIKSRPFSGLGNTNLFFREYVKPKMAHLTRLSKHSYMSSVVPRVRCYTRAFRPGDMLKEVAVSSDAFLESSMDTNKRLITPREDARRQTSASETLKKCKKQAYELKALWDVRTKISWWHVIDRSMMKFRNSRLFRSHSSDPSVWNDVWFPSNLAPCRFYLQVLYNSLSLSLSLSHTHTRTHTIWFIHIQD